LILKHKDLAKACGRTGLLAAPGEREDAERVPAERRRERREKMQHKPIYKEQLKRKKKK